jgi:hypothetical protein
VGARAGFPLKPATLKNKFRNVSRGLPLVAPLSCSILLFKATGNRSNPWRGGSGYQQTFLKNQINNLPILCCPF